MHTKRGYLQGYNGQALVNADQVVIAAELTHEQNVLGQLHPMIAAARESLAQAGITERLGQLLADAGYCSEANLAALRDLSGAWIDRVHARKPPDGMILDMDSSESPVHGDQEGAAWNGHFQSKCLHPLFVFNQFGDLERCVLRPGNVHSADGWEDVLRPVLARYSKTARPSITRRRFRADAAFAIPALFDLLEAEGWDYSIRIKGNPKLHERISWLTKRGPGRPPHHVVRRYTSFHYRAKSWSKPRRVVAKVEFHRASCSQGSASS